MFPRMGLERHPWNVGFAWEARRGPFRRLTASQADRFDAEGWLLLEDLLGPAVVDAAARAIDRSEEEVERFLRTRPGGRLFIAEAGAITFSTNLASRHPRLRALVSGPPLADVARDLLGRDVRFYWDQAVYKKPERPRVFPVHQDNGYGFVEPQPSLTLWIALTDATAENGCPRVLPGLHRLGTLRHRLEPEGYVLPLDVGQGVAVPVRAGSVLAFSSLLPHATGPNTSGAVRKAYIAQYAVEDAAYLHGDPDAGPPVRREPIRDLPAARQWRLARPGDAPEG
jgi:ectoine hydroxylase-related dioxygenase (phytanoyl-CoA dioxygenase family)